MNSNSDHPLAYDKLVLRPLIGLMDGESPEEIKRHTIREIVKHRNLREQAVILEAQACSALDPTEAREVKHAYVAAMVAVHAQQTVVSTLVDILGYVPKAPTDRGH